MRLTIYFLLGLLFMLLQTTIIPWVVPALFKPDLLLILVIYIGLGEPLLRGAALTYLLGMLHDVFAGSYLGLYGLVFLVLFLAARGAMRWFDTENSPLLLAMVFFGTLLKGGLVIFVLGLFADAGQVWPLVLKNLPTQAFASLVAAMLILSGLSRLQRMLGPRWQVPGLQRLDRDHGF
ncbi:MAG: rod shape-determining protein MreD [Desulfuromonadales bacterium]|nr:rod shape-determining protein MreD [Desulfuromonadales bacterium]NIR33154.1 rod shape-determining protein MreD [Desulfuromonadales bacterium]NIS41938.1 rod shape-determining protein MreD [Desulfuromonadales bacterium]